MPNLNYNYITDIKGLEGQIITNRTRIRRTGYNKSGVIIPFGRPVVYAGNNINMELPSATEQTIIGITYLDRIFEDAVDANDDSGVPNNKHFGYLTSGDIFVRTEVDIAHNDPVYFRHTANGVGKSVIGRFRNDADLDDDTDPTCDLLPNARFLPVYENIDGAVIAKAGELVILSLNLE